MASTAPSKITTRDLYIESLEELLTAARKYVTKFPNTPIAPDPMAMLCAELNTHQKQFELIMKQNSDLLTNMAQNSGGNSGGGGSGGGGGGGGGGDNKGGGGGGQCRQGGRQQNKDAKICPTVARWNACSSESFLPGGQQGQETSKLEMTGTGVK